MHNEEMNRIFVDRVDNVYADALGEIKEGFHSATSLSEKERPFGVLGLPEELLLQILCNVGTSPRTWLNLALTHSRFRSIVYDQAFCIGLTGRC